MVAVVRPDKEQICRNIKDFPVQEDAESRQKDSRLKHEVYRTDNIGRQSRLFDQRWAHERGNILNQLFHGQTPRSESEAHNKEKTFGGYSR